MFDTLAKAMPFLQSDICPFLAARWARAGARTGCAPSPRPRARRAFSSQRHHPPSPRPDENDKGLVFDITGFWPLWAAALCGHPRAIALTLFPRTPPRALPFHAVPGVGKDCIGLFVENNPTGSFLTINVTKASSEEHDEAGVGGRTWHISEASGGFQTRTFPLPVAFNAAAVKVLSHKDGLCVHAHKLPAAPHAFPLTPFPPNPHPPPIVF